MDKEQIIEILKRMYDEDNPWTTPYHAECADEILALQEKKEAHRPNCTSIVYGRTEDPAKCICHSWRRDKCPECQKENKKSKVYPTYTTTTPLYCPPGYYDEDGEWSELEDGNTITQNYRCSNGHEFSETL